MFKREQEIVSDMTRKRVPAPFRLISATALAGTSCWLTPFLFIRFISRGHICSVKRCQTTGTSALARSYRYLGSLTLFSE